MASYGKWFIGPTTGSSVRGAEVESIEMCPEKTADDEWFEWNGSEMIEVVDISIECVDEDQIVSDDYTVVEDYVFESNQLYDLPAADNDGSDDFATQNSRSQADFQKSNDEDLQLENKIENDPRDMYFILQNWTQIWQSSSTGFPVYSSNYPGGIFRTDEGYEFELEISPKEFCRENNLFLSKWHQ